MKTLCRIWALLLTLWGLRKKYDVDFRGPVYWRLKPKYVIGYWDSGRIKMVIAGRKEADVICKEHIVVNCLPLYES